MSMIAFLDEVADPLQGPNRLDATQSFRPFFRAPNDLSLSRRGPTRGESASERLLPRPTKHSAGAICSSRADEQVLFSHGRYGPAVGLSDELGRGCLRSLLPAGCNPLELCSRSDVVPTAEKNGRPAMP